MYFLYYNFKLNDILLLVHVSQCIGSTVCHVMICRSVPPTTPRRQSRPATSSATQPTRSRSASPTAPHAPAETAMPQPIRRQQPSYRPPLPAEPRLIDKVTPQAQDVIPQQNRRPQPIIVEDHRPPAAAQTTPPAPIITRVDQVIAKHVPKQYEINRIMKIIKRKVIRDYNLPIELNALRMAQQSSAEFKSIYDYIAHNILPNDKRARRSIILQSEQFILVNDVMFRLFFHTNDEHFSFQLAVPEPYIDTIISRYHDGLLSSHAGVVRTYLTMRRKFYFKNQFEKIANYVRGCGRCQEIKGKTDNLRPYHPRIPDDYCPFQHISLDFKSMPRTSTGYKHIMVVCCNITRYLVCVPLKDLEAETVCEAFVQKIITNYGIPSLVVTDLAPTLTGKLFSTLCSMLQIDHRCISVKNHGSLMVERHIQTIGDMIKSNLGCYGIDWVRYVSIAQFGYNTFASPHLGGHSPYYLLYLRDPPDIGGMPFTAKVDLGLSHTYQEYVDSLKSRFRHVSKTMLELQKHQQMEQNEKISQKLEKRPLYSVGQLVYLHKPDSSSVTVPSRKFQIQWTGPYAIRTVLDSTHYEIMTLDGKVIQDVFSYNRLKPAFIHSSDERKNITNLDKLRQALNRADTRESQNSGQSVHFTDECGKDLGSTCIDDQNFLFTEQATPVNVTEHAQLASANNGFAAPTVLSEKQKVRLLQVLESAPAEASELSIVKARFKAGNLQVLLSSSDKPKDRYWWPIHLYPDCTFLVQQILDDSSIQCSGSPRKHMRRLYL